ncbi:hypothetical protein [Paraburkholderia graminis]|uniref:hypothetical protein n=1 Tax=Paraburkholderia graminis TaxID=60548 RepID=UPI0012903476|nr:hypothetical protein [Paraburkholderia graminis]
MNRDSAVWVWDFRKEPIKADIRQARLRLKSCLLSHGIRYSANANTGEYQIDPSSKTTVTPFAYSSAIRRKTHTDPSDAESHIGPLGQSSIIHRCSWRTVDREKQRRNAVARPHRASTHNGEVPAVRSRDAIRRIKQSGIGREFGQAWSTRTPDETRLQRVCAVCPRAARHRNLSGAR